MELAERLAGLLNQYMQKTVKTKNQVLCAWRFDLHESSGIEIGLKNNMTGGPYSAPSYKRSISGELYLIWENNRFTNARLDSQVFDNFDEYCNLWETTAYYDADGVGLYEPRSIPEVELEDPTVNRIVEQDVHLPFELLDLGLKYFAGRGLRKVDSKVKCHRNERVIMNSNGLRVVYRQTPVEFFFEGNDCYGEAYQEKKWPKDDEIARVLQNTADISLALGEEAVGRSFSGPIRLLFPPGVFEAFLNQFLLTNLAGSLVMNRQSCYDLEDFHSNRQVLRDDLTLQINNLLPLRSFSYRCTGEAVPGGVIDLISGGRLQTPVLNLKYARKAGMQPTPVASGGRGFFLKSTRNVSPWEDLVRSTDRGLIVYSILGLHTQDVSSGHFSLTADQGLLVENGRVLGKVKAIINGDFLGSLMRPESEFGFMVGEDNPGYAFMANATI